MSHSFFAPLRRRLQGAPVIATVGGDPLDAGLADRMPWLAASGIELRWVPAAMYSEMNMYATGCVRLQQEFRSDVVLLLDADTLIRRPFDEVVERVFREQVLAGVIAHSTPLLHGRLDQPDWAQLFSLCGLPEPRLEHEHTGWGYFFSDARYRYCPPYFNYGVIAAPVRTITQIGGVVERHLKRLREMMNSYFDGQLAFTMSIAELGIRVLPLPMRYNMANKARIEAIHHREIDEAVILHLLSEQRLRRVETFASLENIEAFLTRTDLRVTSQMAQEVIRSIFPALVAEEKVMAAVA